MHDYFDLCKICYNHYYCTCYYYCWEKIKHIFPSNERKEFHQKTIKSYFNIEYIKFFYLLQKEIKLNKNIHNINVLIDLLSNKKIKNKLYDLYNNIVLNKFVHGNNFIFGNKYKKDQVYY